MDKFSGNNVTFGWEYISILIFQGRDLKSNGAETTAVEHLV
jgi:hypothetical protein